MDEFSCSTKIFSGAGAVKALAALGARRVFVVSDPFFAANGTAAQIAAAAGAAHSEIFSEVQPDPSVELVAQATARLKAFEPDLVIALGGGSAMDCAKATVYFSKVPCRLAAIPTTSGSGSEVTDFAIVTHGNVKHPLVDASLRPDIAILDSDLLNQLPPSLIADSGFDVLSHALESFVATGAGAFTDALAQDAFRTAYALLPASFAGDTQVRLRMHQAATMAGLAFTQAGLGLCHAMSHSLGGLFHVPHGRLNAILLPSVISCNAHSAGSKYAILAKQAGMGGSADAVALRNLRNNLIRLRRELQLPQTLAQAGIAPAEVWEAAPEIIRATLADPCCKTNPAKVDEGTVRHVLEEVTGHV